MKSVPRQIDPLQRKEASAVLRELREASASLQVCFGELERVLAQPSLDVSALTSVRLKLAGLRLTRGPLVGRVLVVLAGNVTEAEAATLVQLRVSHQRLLQFATSHIAKWTLEAIATNWAAFRRETREILHRWRAKAERDQRLVYPLVQRCAEG